MEAQKVSGLTRAFLLELIAMGEEVEICSVLRPDNVLITNDSIRVKNPMPVDAFVPVAGFAAPEQYVAGDSARAPVYFVGALMYTLLYGMPPPDVRDRLAGKANLLHDGSELGNIVQRCLELHPDRRYVSLLFVLEALQKVDGIDSTEQVAEVLEKEVYSVEKKPKKKSGKKLLVTVLVVLLLCGGFLAYTLVQGQWATEALAAGDFAKTVEILDRTPWLKTLRGESYAYASAMQLRAAGSYDQALALLQSIPGYADSAAAIQAIQYEQAAAFLQTRQLDQAKALFDGLGDYQDSAAQSQQIAAYQQAQALEDPLARYQALGAFSEYLDSKSLMQDAGAELYEQAMASYLAGDIAGAGQVFTALGNYSDAPVYQQLCALWADASEEAGENRAALQAVMAYNGVADLEPILMSDRFFMVFLEGDWTSADGGGEMSFGEEEFKAPLLGGNGKRWAFQNRSITNADTTLGAFGYLSPDEITVTVSATGETFTYQRVVV